MFGLFQWSDIRSDWRPEIMYDDRLFPNFNPLAAFFEPSSS
jgi:hypothetical protein